MTTMTTAERAALLRQDFPVLQRRIGEHELVYLDNGATSQKPAIVLDTLDDYYRRYNANVHRGAHTMSEEATGQYENARLRIARFINAPSDEQIIYTSGSTEAVNLVAHAWGRANLGPGDDVLITEMEHHSNIVPWHIMRDQLGFTLRYVPVTDRGLLRLAEILAKSLLSVQAALVLVRTTPFHDLLWALRGLGLPRLLVAVVGLMYRYLFVLADEAGRLLRARAEPGHRGCLFGSVIFFRQASAPVCRDRHRSRTLACSCCPNWRTSRLRLLGGSKKTCWPTRMVRRWAETASG